MKHVYLNEYNILMEKSAYLPIASGLLRAYAETNETIKNNYEFQPFLYHMDSLAKIIPRYKDPDVAGFSVSMWNEQLNLAVAKEVKQRWPNCLIVFGGPQVPQHPQEYFKKHPFIDVAVRAEGEEAFSKVLLRNLESRDFMGLTGVSYRDGDEVVRNTVESHQPKDLDMYPSPYLEGLFDDIMNDGLEMQAIIETNRGCPFPCSFCYWGQGGLSRKYRFHGVDRVKLEIEWAAKNKIKYLFNADSNFGMHKRDEEIAQILVDTKTQYGFPDKFRTCFGKNADERIYGIAKQLHDAGMEKGITLALQSNDPVVLKNINRQNIKMEAYKSLQVKFNEAEVPVYSELILGMPGETYETWKNGIETLLQAGLKNQLFVYLCQIFPNTEMADTEYQKKFGIVTKRIELNEIHGQIRSKDLVTEYEDVIITTDSMDLKMWRQMVAFSWLMMTFHSLKIGFYLMLYLANRYGRKYTDFLEHVAKSWTPYIRAELDQFSWQIENILSGRGRGRMIEGYAPIYWDEEEASFLRISEHSIGFYRELEGVVKSFQDCDEDELSDVIKYQRLMTPTFNHDHPVKTHFSHNICEYFDRILSPNPVPLVKKVELVTFTGRKFESKDQFAKETILWGRKSGTIMNKVEW